MDTGLKGRVVLVTGASKGIGAAAARAFGGEQARVAITYHRNHQGARQVSLAVEAAGGEAMIVPFRLEDSATAAQAVQTVTDRWGGVDVLVANAVDWGGNTLPDPSVRFEDVPLDQWQRMLSANLIGAVPL